MNRLTAWLVHLAHSSVGVHEEGGRNRGPQVDAWNARVGAPLGSPWCASMAWCLVDDACSSLFAPNPIHRTASVHRMWEEIPKRCRIPEPIPGALCLHDSGGGKGHMGIVVRLADDAQSKHWVWAVEGNTNLKGSREGTTCMLKRRSRSYWNLGFLDPSVPL